MRSARRTPDPLNARHECHPRRDGAFAHTLCSLPKSLRIHPYPFRGTAPPCSEQPLSSAAQTLRSHKCAITSPPTIVLSKELKRCRWCVPRPPLAPPSPSLSAHAGPASREGEGSLSGRAHASLPCVPPQARRTQYLHRPCRVGPLRRLARRPSSARVVP